MAYNVKMKKSRFMNRRILVVVLAVPIVVLLVIIYIGYLKGIGRVKPVFVNNDLIFKIDYGFTTNSLFHLIIIDTASSITIWDIELNSFCGASLKYGEIPQDFETFNGATNSAKQLFPKTGAPSDLVEGRVYKMYYKWQYDIGISAASGSQKQFFEIRNKKIVFVRNPNPKPPPKKPSDR